MIRRLMLKRARDMSSPPSMIGIPSVKWSVLVTIPATAPAATAPRRARGAGTPARMRTAAVEPPRVKLPSTVRSNSLSTRKRR